ncbi:MAG: ABC transporter substrate-binding protein [Candidatus Omnitrophica bacterium]|nr:ABC transporter substrate-binding protein [Candidatus Omnitrophota bacterium]
MKVVSLSPSFTEIIFSLRKGGDLEAVTDLCPALERDILRVGSPKVLQIDRISECKPDLIFADIHENRPEEITALKEKGLKVQSFEIRSIESVLDAVAEISRLLGAREEGENLIRRIQDQRNQNRDRFQGREALQTLILLWDRPYLTVNFNTYVSQLVEASGGFNVFHEEPVPEIPIELEDMIDKKPELLLLPTTPYSFQPRHLTQFKQYRVFSQIPIRLVDGRLFSRFGPATYEALKILGGLIDHAREAYRRIR